MLKPWRLIHKKIIKYGAIDRGGRRVEDTVLMLGRAGWARELDVDLNIEPTTEHQPFGTYKY